MLVSIREWYGARSLREQRLVQAMGAIAVPLFAWLLLVTPLSKAYENALTRSLEATDRNARVHAILDRRGVAVKAPAAAPDLNLYLQDSAGQSGLTAQAVAGGAPGSSQVTIASASPAAALAWVHHLEAQGYRLDVVRFTPVDKGVAVTMTVAGAGQ